MKDLSVEAGHRIQQISKKNVYYLEFFLNISLKNIFETCSFSWRIRASICRLCCCLPQARRLVQMAIAILQQLGIEKVNICISFAICNFEIFKIYKSKLRDSSFVALLIPHHVIRTLDHILKTTPVAAIPVTLYFRSKSAEHDVTLTSLTANL